MCRGYVSFPELLMPASRTHWERRGQFLMGYIRCLQEVSLRRLTEGERKSLNSRIKEFNLKGSVFDSTLLPDELIETGIPDLTGAVRGGIKSTIVAGRGAVQCHPEAHRLTVLRRA